MRLSILRVRFITSQLPSYRTTTITRKMSTFKLQDSDIEVTLTPDLKKEELLEFPAFKVYAHLN